MKTSNQYMGDNAEELSAQFFNMKPTIASGRFKIDKLDNSNEFVKSEIKSTKNKSYSIQHAKLELWKLQASKSGKKFFAHIFFADPNGKLNIQDSVVLIDPRFLKSLLENQKDVE